MPPATPSSKAPALATKPAVTVGGKTYAGQLGSTDLSEPAWTWNSTGDSGAR
jgi:hypothetical protein